MAVRTDEHALLAEGRLVEFAAVDHEPAGVRVLNRLLDASDDVAHRRRYI